MACIRFQRILLETVALFPNRRFLKLGTLTRPTTFKPTLFSHSETTPIGQELAITFNTVTPRSNSEAQRICFFFIYAQFTSVGTQELRLCPLPPVKSGGLQAAWGDGFVTVLPAHWHNYVWAIKSSDIGHM